MEQTEAGDDKASGEKASEDKPSSGSGDGGSAEKDSVDKVEDEKTDDDEESTRPALGTFHGVPPRTRSRSSESSPKNPGRSGRQCGRNNQQP